MADKALLVGINRYKDAPLNGCVNDIHDMANLLADKYKFKEDNIRLIADNRADTYGIIKRLWWLVDVNPGDRVFFQFSGHGTQYPTRDGRHELDGLLEVICPFDFNWSEDKMVTDKKFVAIFTKIPKRVRFTWVSDCCHSGDLTRSIAKEPRHPRMYPQPVDIAWRNRGLKNKGIVTATRAMSGGQLDVGFISGCQSNQTSADACIHGRWNGALTYYLIRNLKKLPVKSSLKKIRTAVANDLKKNRYTQRPQVEGSRINKPFLG